MSIVVNHNKLPVIDPSELGDPDLWTVIDLDANWPEILPLIRHDAEFERLATEACAEFNPLGVMLRSPH